MTVVTYNPNLKNPVSFSDSAIKHLAVQVNKQQAKGVEFKVKASGCSGFKYLLELAFDPEADSTHYALDKSLDLFISPKVIPLIKGTHVDYVQEGVNFRLEFTNPNATAHCGCGESFSVEK